MSAHRSRRIDRDTAEQLLGGAVVDSEAGQASLAEQHAALSGLLAAVAAPTADGELPGEREAMAAFREARRNPAPQPRRRTMADTALARAFTAKAVLAAFGVTALGGVAVAAGTGNLPAALGGGPDERAHAITAPTESKTPSGSASTAGGGDRSPGAQSSEGGTAHPTTGTAGSSSAGRSTGPTAATDPGALDLAQLCRVFNDRVAGGAKARDLGVDQGFQPLVKAAGGVDQMTGYCTTTAKPSPAAGNDQGHQTDKPASAGTKTDRATPPAASDPTKGGSGKN